MSGCAAGCGRSAGRSGGAEDEGALPALAGNPAAEGPRVGLDAQGTLADLGIAPLPRALPNAYWRELGLGGFTDPYRRFRDA